MSTTINDKLSFFSVLFIGEFLHPSPVLELPQTSTYLFVLSNEGPCSIYLEVESQSANASLTHHHRRTKSHSSLILHACNSVQSRYELCHVITFSGQPVKAWIIAYTVWSKPLLSTGSLQAIHRVKLEISVTLYSCTGWSMSWLVLEPQKQVFWWHALRLCTHNDVNFTAELLSMMMQTIDSESWKYQAQRL